MKYCNIIFGLVLFFIEGSIAFRRYYTEAEEIPEMEEYFIEKVDNNSLTWRRQGQASYRRACLRNYLAREIGGTGLAANVPLDRLYINEQDQNAGNAGNVHILNIENNHIENGPVFVPENGADAPNVEHACSIGGVPVGPNNKIRLNSQNRIIEDGEVALVGCFCLTRHTDNLPHRGGLFFLAEVNLTPADEEYNEHDPDTALKFFQLRIEDQAEDVRYYSITSYWEFDEDEYNAPI